MSSIPLPVYMAVLFFLGSAILLEIHHRFQNRQRALPARDDFLAAHSQKQPECHVCASRNVVETGFSHGEDERRIVACGDCKALLFQYRREAEG